MMSKGGFVPLGSESLLAFTQLTYPSYRAEPVHQLIAETLDRVVSGEIKRLMIFAPPQHGKSELVSIHLPAYWLGHRPDDPVMLASYAASLAYAMSRRARRIVESEQYQAMFGLGTDRASRAVDYWELAGYRGNLKAVGVGGGITGHGGLLGIIDDPHENWEQAQSPTYRERVWEWWRSTFRPRVWDEGAIVIILTRWHEDDLAGRILKEQGNEWEVLRLPAVAETQEVRDAINARMGLKGGLPDPLDRHPGEPLAPLRYPRETLSSLERDLGSMAWSSEYQGYPISAAGNRFKRWWFPIVSNGNQKPVKVARYWDKAGTEGGTGAYTCGVLMAKYASGKYHVEDVTRGRWSALERESVIKQAAVADRERFGSVTIYVEQEPGSGGKESAESTIRNLVGYDVRADRPTGDKAVRANPYAAQAEAGNVLLALGAWNQAYIDELVAFPKGTHKDQVDASSGAFNKLAPLAASSANHDPVIPRGAPTTSTTLVKPDRRARSTVVIGRR